MKNKVLNKIFSKNSITLYAVVAVYAVVSALIYGGGASRQLSNMVISLSCYVVMAVSLNLVVGFLGELSLGHAGFMSVGLFTGCLFSIALEPVLPLGAAAAALDDHRRSGCRADRVSGWVARPCG